VYLSVTVVAIGAACDSLIAYYLLVFGWGDPLVLFETAALTQAASALSNLDNMFDVLRKY
jgi:hypothetical protein